MSLNALPDEVEYPPVSKIQAVVLPGYEHLGTYARAGKMRGEGTDPEAVMVEKTFKSALY
jgi:hypothetical protein